MTIGRTLLWIATAGYCGRNKPTAERTKEEPVEVFPEETITPTKPFNGLTPFETRELQKTRDINLATNLAELKSARENAIEDIATFQKIDGVTLRDALQELKFLKNPSHDSISWDSAEIDLNEVLTQEKPDLISKISNELRMEADEEMFIARADDQLPNDIVLPGKTNKELTDAIFLTSSPQEVNELKFAGVRAAIRKYGKYPQAYGSEQLCYLSERGVSKRIDFYSNNYTELQSVLQQQRGLLETLKQQAGIKSQ